mmetsp:Transcript_2552/g.10948  ORF Transcript_2552/g.10948 Transcript_2552/m.10948 type:complete len:248 (+) Transcript_2552:2062-2805(+)
MKYNCRSDAATLHDETHHDETQGETHSDVGCLAPSASIMNSSSSRMCPRSIALSNELRPFASLSPTLAPLRISSFATPSWSFPTATCSGVSPVPASARLTSAPFCTSASTMGSSPRNAAAARGGVTPSTGLTLAPLAIASIARATSRLAIASASSPSQCATPPRSDTSGSKKALATYLAFTYAALASRPSLGRGLVARPSASHAAPSNTRLCRSFPHRVKNETTEGSHARTSRTHDRTLETCTPSCR